MAQLLVKRTVIARSNSDEAIPKLIDTKEIASLSLAKTIKNQRVFHP